MAFGRNNDCPCGSGHKFKKCCLGLGRWENLRSTDFISTRWLSVRGKNLLFLNDLADALQLDNVETTNRGFKNAFTPQAVKRIFESVASIWPDQEDYERALKKEAPYTSGLYVGTGEPEPILAAVRRHSLYCDTIFLVDPFYHPQRMRDEFNPILHPEEHRVNAIRAATIWISLIPWIEAGLVKFIRTPRDFDSQLERRTIQIERDRFAKFPELKEISDKSAEALANTADTHKQYYILCRSDDFWRKEWIKDHPNASPEEVAAVLRMINEKRENHPYYVNPLYNTSGKSSQFLIHSTGANYEMAKLTAMLSGSHLVTDLPTRWKEIEMDRQSAKIDSGKWSPFAKAFQDSRISYLENVSLENALDLRQRGHLEHMRGFLRKVWKSSSTEPAFDDANVENLTAELLERIREANDEWQKIDRDLIKWGVGTAGAATAAIATGGVGWLPAIATAVASGIGGLAVANHQRRAFADRYPAGFFLKLAQ